jgi:uncharacterized membrane protein YhaH (DUF805 family)
MADVFISYAREDQARAAQIAHGLEAMGLDIFWDTEIPPGQTWADYIEGKLSSCKAVIVLWSEHSTRSQWVREEARMGKEKAKLIPALLDNAPAPFGFGEVQAANLSTWNGATNAPEWTRFSQAVFTAVNGAGATPPPQAAPVAPAYAPPPRPQQYAATDGAVEQLSPLGYIQKCLRLYVDGKGRARRAEYWWWVLFTLLVSLVAIAIDAGMSGMNPYTNMPNTQYLYGAASLALLAPSISVLSRRFHDVGLSGWLVAGAVGVYVVGSLLAASVPAAGVLSVIAGLGVLVVALIPSRPGANQYGPNPKGQ